MEEKSKPIYITQLWIDGVYRSYAILMFALVGCAFWTELFVYELTLLERMMVTAITFVMVERFVWIANEHQMKKEK